MGRFQARHPRSRLMGSVRSSPVTHHTGVATKPRTITFRADPDLRAALEQVAADEGCTTTDVIRHALTDLLTTRADSEGEAARVA